MKVLVVGQGGREHALVRALKLSSSVTEVHAIPGSDGIAAEALCHKVDTSDRDALKGWLARIGVELAVIGPEVPLAEGLADFIREQGVDVFGPSSKGARLEASKVFSKEFMSMAGVPTAPYFVVDSVEQTMKMAKEFEPPYVLKADGLAAGKGVAICTTEQELKQIAINYFEEKTLGEAAEKALLEKFEPGWELSFHILTNGEDYMPLPLSQDHKRLLDSDEGPNTGGMGVVGPFNIDTHLEQQIHETILRPTVEQIKKMHMDYRGVLYVGIMVTDEGPKVLEYNVRFGDPETQVLMPLLEGDWGQVMRNVAQGKTQSLSWKPLYSACIVLAAEGYPEKPIKGVSIEGDPLAQTPSSYFLHAGTKKDGDKWLVNGGRTLNAVAIGSTLKEAIDNAYKQAEQVSWPGMQMRVDIGRKVLNLQ